MAVPNIGRVGVWSMGMRFGDHAAIDEGAVELEELGYGALWIPGGIDDGVLADFDRLLAKTSRIALCTGIAAWWKAQSPANQARVWLGIGISHGPIIGEAWGKPVAVTRDWVERALAAGLPADAMNLAALGPKMLELARDKTSGAHPYLVTPEHTALARKICC
jgi:probable F420-dependent oxidoreductase